MMRFCVSQRALRSEVTPLIFLLSVFAMDLLIQGVNLEIKPFIGFTAKILNFNTQSCMHINHQIEFILKVFLDGPQMKIDNLNNFILEIWK